MSLTERLEHDEAGRIVVLTNADGVRSRFFYGAANVLQPVAIVRAGVATGYAHDAQGRVIAVADTSGRGIALTYDAAGRVNAVTDAQGYKQELSLDSEGKVLRAGMFEPGQLQPLRAAYRFYDNQQRLARHLLPDGRISAYTYDDSAAGQGRLAEHSDGDDVLHLHRSNAQGQAARIDLASDGLMRVALGGLPATPSQPHVQRDDFGRAVLQWRPEQGLTTRVFDAAGHVVREALRDRVAQAAGHSEQGFDAAGRLLWRRTFDNKSALLQTTNYTYEGVRLKTRSDDAQDQRFEHDEAGRITATTITLKDDNARSVFTTTLHTKYDAQGQPIAKTLADGQALRIERDAATGVARQLTLQSARWARVHERLAHWLPATWAATARGWLPQDSVVRDIAFHPYNGITGLTHGNGLHTSKQFDIAGRLTALNAGTDRLSYGYGAGPRIRKLGDKTLEYTGFGQLKEQDTARVIKTATNAAAGMAKLEFDNLGRIVNDGVNRYTFTADGQVRSVSTQDNRPIATYRYNALRQRVGKTVEQRTTYFLWHDGKLVAEIEGSGEHAGQISAQYLYLADEGKAQPIAKLEAAHAAGNTTGRGRTLFIHANHRGEPMAMSNGQQRVVWRASSDAWGFIDAAQLREQQAELNIRLPGQYFDAESGLHDNWHRSYDPRPGSAAKGRYLSPDPAGYPDGPDAYAYVNGDPINKTDPTGLYEEDVHYYLTFFLARIAGLSEEAGRNIALGAQYIDDNPLTQPLSGAITPNRRALPLYHFTRERGADLTNDPITRIQNPTSAQLENLRRPSMDERLSPCARQRFFGEYLHAFEDTFSHRDQNNVPFFFTSTAGHGAFNHDPDQTYNVREFQNNEMRTMRMAQEVFEQIQSFGGGAAPRTWGDVSVAVLQFVRTGQGAGNAAGRWQDNCYVAPLACDPATAQERHGAEIQAKAAVLERQLVAFDLASVGDLVPDRGRLSYNRGEADRRRRDNLRGLTHQADPNSGQPGFPGVLLPGD
jgi:RHS repeat-associated protein